MSRGNRRLAAGRWPRRLAIAVAVSALAGCAFFQPYVAIPAEAPPDVAREPVVFAGNANAEIARVEAARQDYLSRMQTMSRTKAAFATGATVLTGWALYNVLKPNAPGVTEMTHADKNRAARLGAVVGTAYGLSQYMVNPSQESAYNDGYRALTCLLRQSAPLLMPVGEEAGVPSQQVLARELATLNGKITALHQFVAVARVGLSEGAAEVAQAEAQLALDTIARNQALPDTGPQAARKRDAAQLSAAVGEGRAALPPGVVGQPGLPGQIRAAETALARARNAWSDGQALLTAVSGSGREIRERGHTIVATINGVIRAAQADLQRADASLTQAQDIASGFIKIGMPTAGDQAERAAEEKSARAAPGADTAWALGGAPGGMLLGGSLAMVTLAHAAAASGAKTAAPADTRLTVGELQALGEAVQKSLKAAREREAKEAQEKLVGGYVGKLRELAALKGLCKTREVDDMERCDGTALAWLTEDLYAARRPVVAAILHFRAQARAARRISGCPSDAGVRVTPDETTLARAGDTVTFIVSQPKPGQPVVMLQGARGDGIAELKSTSLGTAGTQVEITFGPKAGGRYTLLAADATGEYSESVLVVVKPAPPAPPASASGGA